MPRAYKLQTQIETLSVKTGIASYRLSEQRYDLFGGEGKNYDELVYLRGQNGDNQAVNRFHGDAWVKFGGAEGGDGSKRADQAERTFHDAGTYP